VILLIVGVVGKMASGKSTVCRYLQTQIEDTEIIDVDNAAKAIYCEEPEVVEELKECFGNSICFPEGNLNYNNLALKIFSSQKELEKINTIMFPKIEKKVNKILEEKKDKNCLVIDAAILFDSELYKLCDYIIWVKTNRSRRFKQLSALCDLDEEEVNTRLDGQIINIKERLVDFIIYNNGTLQGLEKNVEKISDAIKSGSIK
jgi:dephospho-CoA kinase